MTVFIQFIRALMRKWWFPAFTILSAGSTAASYIPQLQPYLATSRWIPVSVFAAAWVIAAYQLYAEKHRELQACQGKLAGVPARETDLLIHAQGGKFYRLSGPGSPHVTAIFLRFKLAVENRGSRPALINLYHLGIDDTGKSYPAQEPIYKSSVTTPKTSVGLSQDFLSKDGYFTVDGGKVTAVGHLDFYVPDVPADDQNRIHCTLKIVDTTGGAASHTFELIEYQSI